jgi:hypothetical protein
MALDPSIALGVKPIELPNQLAQYGQMQQILAAQDAQQMNALKMQEARATMDERNMLRRLDPNAPDYESQLFKVSPQLGINYRKEAAAAKASGAATSASLASAAKSRQELLGQALRDISDRPSDANIIAHTEDIQASPLFSAEEKAKALVTQQTLLGIPFEQRGTYLASQGAKASELKPTTQVVDQSGQKIIVQTPAFSGQPKTVGTYADVPLPANVQQQKIQIARESRPPAQPRAESPLVAIEGPDGNPILVSREEAKNKKPANMIEKPMTEGQRLRYNKDKVSDKDVVTGAFAVTGELEKLTDELVGNPDKNIAPAPGLNSITGFNALTNAIAVPSGNARKALQKLETFKGKIMALGRQLASQEGKLGNMAVQEWKFVSDAVQKIDPAAGNLDEQMRDAVRQAKEYANRQQSKYEDTYADEPVKQTGNTALGVKPTAAAPKVVEFGSLK